METRMVHLYLRISRLFRTLRGMVLRALATPAVAASLAEDAPDQNLPIVWVLSTGGTISGKGGSSTSLTEYKVGTFLGEELVAAVPEIKQVATIRAEQITNVVSHDLTIKNWLALANRINEIFSTD